MTDVVRDIPRFCLSQTRVLPLHRQDPLSLFPSPSLIYMTTLKVMTLAKDLRFLSSESAFFPLASIWCPSGILYHLFNAGVWPVICILVTSVFLSPCILVTLYHLLPAHSNYGPREEHGYREEYLPRE